jgi:purine-binding chemotaxis protein CheW
VSGGTPGGEPEDPAGGVSEPAAEAGRLRILRDRARLLARAEAADDAAEQTDYLVFQLAWENYAVEAGFIREIYPLKELTPIPCTPAFVLGVINLRGELCPVIDLKRLFGLPDQSLTNATSAIILSDAAMEFGVVADVITGVRPLAPRDVRPPPLTLSGIDAAFLKGVTDDRVAILDAGRILGHSDLIVNQQVDS